MPQNKKVLKVAEATSEAYEIRYGLKQTVHFDCAERLVKFAKKRGYRVHSVYVTDLGSLRALLVDGDGMARRAWNWNRWRWADSSRKKGHKPKPVISPLADKRINKYHVVIE